MTLVDTLLIQVNILTVNGALHAMRAVDGGDARKMSFTLRTSYFHHDDDAAAAYGASAQARRRYYARKERAVRALF